ncbi:MAG: hypothetical protein IPL93_16120 [Actinomycetales bacterium]|nr:hypothetical protein [Actinomycetales bacterium]
MTTRPRHAPRRSAATWRQHRGVDLGGSEGGNLGIAPRALVIAYKALQRRWHFITDLVAR